MDETPTQTPPSPSVEPVKALPSGETRKGKARQVVTILVGLLILAAIITGIVLLFMSAPDTVGKIRDVFIIFLALESLIIGVALIVLVIQLALLINVLQNEIKPILETTNETVSTLKGTTTFISDNLASPVIKLNEYLAGLRKLIELLFPPK